MSNAKTPTSKRGIHEQENHMDADTSAPATSASNNSVSSIDWGYIAEASLAAGVALVTVFALNQIANASPADHTVPAVYRRYVTEAADASDDTISEREASDSSSSDNTVSTEHRGDSAEASESAESSELLSSELRSGDSTNNEQHYNSVGGEDGAKLGY